MSALLINVKFTLLAHLSFQASTAKLSLILSTPLVLKTI